MLKKLWSLWTGNTEVRHAGTAFVATLLITAVPFTEEWLRSNDGEWKVLSALGLAILAALLRWAQKALEKASTKKVEDVELPPVV